MNNDSQNTEGKGLAQTTADNIRKIQMLKRIMPVIVSSLPAIGIFLLIVLAVVLIFMPIIATYDFSGGIFNSSTSYNERPPMTMNLGGYELEDVKIFQDIVDQRKKFKEMGSIKAKPSEELDLSLLVSTIQGNIVNNFNDDGDVYKLDDAINESIEEINNFNSIEDFNEFVDKYGTPKQDPGTGNEKYNNDAILENDQNKDYYNNLKDKAGNVYYIYPGSRELLGNMVYNDISYGALEYDRWPCDSSSGWCDNSRAIWSDWSILSKITSNNGESSDCEGNSAVCNIEAAISYAEGYNDDPNSWEYKNIKFDLEQLREETLGGSDSDDIEQTIIDLSGDSEAIIPEGNFVLGQSYVTVSVKKKADYDLYEKYIENVFFKHLFLDCDNCAMKDEPDDIKVKQASVMYDNIYNMKELFDYFNDGENVNNSFGGGTATIPGVSYQCGKYKNGMSEDYSGHRANDLYSTSPSLPNIYPLLEGTVVKVVNNCSSICPRSDAISYINGAKLSTLSSACSCGGGWGNHIQIKSTYNGKTIYAIYAHFSSVNVSVGDNVTYNTILGVMGTTGVSTGNHLHIELSYTGSSGDKFPPTKIFSTETVLGTLCERNVDSGDEDE